MESPGPAATRPPSSLNAAIRFLVFAAFLLTLGQYYISLLQLALLPPLLFCVAAMLTFAGARRKSNIGIVFSAGGALILFALLSEVVSYFTGDSASFLYGLLLIVLMLSCRLLLLELGFLVILKCYIVSALLSVLIIAVEGKGDLTSYHEGAGRFAGGANVHPNLIGFICAGALPLFVGVAMDLPSGKRRKVIGALTLLTLYILFTTGSRGSLGALLITLLILFTRSLFQVRTFLQTKLGVSVLVLIVLGALGGLYFVSHGALIRSTGEFLDTAFSITSKERGIHSGLSGRTGLWSYALHRVKGISWLVGLGYRQGLIIDSGYVTVLVESGILGAAIIIGSIIRVAVWLWVGARQSTSSGIQRYRMTLLAMMLIYLINNISTRYLFSYGNQFSLLILFMMLSRKEDILLDYR